MISAFWAAMAHVIIAYINAFIGECQKRKTEGIFSRPEPTLQDSAVVILLILMLTLALYASSATPSTVGILHPILL